MAFLRIVSVEVTYMNMSCSREVVWSLRTWKLIGFLPSYLRPFFPVTSVRRFICSRLSLSLSVPLLSCPFYYFPFFSVFIFFSPPFKSFIFLCFISPSSLRISYCFHFSILFSSALHFCFCLSLPPPRSIYFRYSSANECIKFPANRERKLRITSMWTPSVERWTCRSQGRNVELRNDVFTKDIGMTPCSLSHFRRSSSSPSTCIVPRCLPPYTFRLSLLGSDLHLTQNCVFAKRNCAFCS